MTEFLITSVLAAMAIVGLLFIYYAGEAERVLKRIQHWRNLFTIERALSVLYAFVWILALFSSFVSLLWCAIVSYRAFELQYGIAEKMDLGVWEIARVNLLRDVRTMAYAFGVAVVAMIPYVVLSALDRTVVGAVEGRTSQEKQIRERLRVALRALHLVPWSAIHHRKWALSLLAATDLTGLDNASSLRHDLKTILEDPDSSEAELFVATEIVADHLRWRGSTLGSQGPGPRLR